MEKSYFTELNAINVSDKVEVKGAGNRKLSYLSWAWAWGEIKKAHPDTTYTVYENTLPNGYVVNYFTDGKTCYVKVGVTVNGIEHIEFLPVMDNMNKSIPLDKVTSWDVNTAIQRALTKAIARHGLGLYIYAGEDLPEDSTDKTEQAEKVANDPNNKEGSITDEQMTQISVFLNQLDDTKRKAWLGWFEKQFGTNDVVKFSASQAKIVVDKISRGK